MISAGNSELASAYAYNDACLDHAENSVYAEQFMAAAESVAFVEDDLRVIIDIAMSCIPPECKLAKCFCDVLNCYEAGMDWITDLK